MLKQFKIVTLAPTCFGSRRNHHQGAVMCFAKTTKWYFCARRYRCSQCYGGISACCASVGTIKVFLILLMHGANMKFVFHNLKDYFFVNFKMTPPPTPYHKLVSRFLSFFQQKMLNARLKHTSSCALSEVDME